MGRLRAPSSTRSLPGRAEDTVSAPLSTPADDVTAPLGAAADAPVPFSLDDSAGTFGADAPVSVSANSTPSDTDTDAPHPNPDTQTPRREFTHPDQLARYMRNAIARGDQDAIERISRDKEAAKTYAALNEAIEVRAAERAQAIAQSEQAWSNLEQLREYDPQAFGEKLSDPDVAAFYGEMRRYKASQNGLRPAAPQQSAALSFYRTLRADPDAAVLTDEDWDTLDPDNFSQYEPAVAQMRMTRALDRLIAQRTNGKAAKPNPNAVNPQAVRDAIRNAPPTVGGTPPANMSDTDIREAYLRGVDEGRVPDHIRQAYQQMRQRKGFVPLIGR